MKEEMWSGTLRGVNYRCGTHSTQTQTGASAPSPLHIHRIPPSPILLPATAMVRYTHPHCIYIVFPLRPCFFPPLFLFRYAMEAGHPSLYLVYDYMEGGDLGRALAIPPGSHGALTQGERFKVCVMLRTVCCVAHVLLFLV
jgi:hypothetical protein